MARPGISYEDVKTAAVTLLARGANPSIQRVRELLGTGSNSTIAEHLKRWQRELAETPRAQLPATIPESVMAALEVFWRVAVEQAEAGFQELRTQALQAVAAAERARDEAILAEQRTRQELTAREGRLSEAQASIKELGDALLVEREKRVAAEQRAADTAQWADRVHEEADRRAAQWEAEIRQQREEAAQRLAEAEHQLRYERERGEASEARLMRILDQTRREHASERQALGAARDAARTRAEQIQTQLDALRQQLNVTALNLAAAEERGRLQETELAEARELARALENRRLADLQTSETLRAELKTALDERSFWRNRFEKSIESATPRDDENKTSASD